MLQCTKNLMILTLKKLRDANNSAFTSNSNEKPIILSKYNSQFYFPFFANQSVKLEFFKFNLILAFNSGNQFC